MESSSSNMSDNLMEKVTAIGERLKITGTEVGKKVSDGLTSMSFKMKELFQGQNPAEKIVEEATSEAMHGPDWSANLEICDMMNSGNVNSVEFVRGIKKRLMVKHPMVQYLALVLLETCVMNSEKAFSEVAAERVVDEMVKLIDDPETVVNNRNKALILIEAWGQAGDELRYLPIYEETYKSLKSRGIRFPDNNEETSAPTLSDYLDSDAHGANEIPSREIYGDVPPPEPRRFTEQEIKEAFDVATNSVELLSVVLSSSPTQEALQDDLTATLVQQCRRCQFSLQRIIETVDNNESTLFEALNINDEIQKVLTKYEEIQAKNTPPHRFQEERGAPPHIIEEEREPPKIQVAEEPEDSTKEEESLVRKPVGSRGRGGGDEDIMDDLDEMIFGKKGGGEVTGTSQQGDGGKEEKGKKHDEDDDLIRF